MKKPITSSWAQKPGGRQLTDVSIALLDAFAAIDPDCTGVTARQVSIKAQVGVDVGIKRIHTLRAAGYLKIVGARQVDYRSQKVPLYALEQQDEPNMLAEKQPEEPIKRLFGCLNSMIYPQAGAHACAQQAG